MNLEKVAHYVEKKLDVCLLPHKGKPQKDERHNCVIFLVVQWLGLRIFTAVGLGSILVGELRSRKPRIVGKKERD